MPRRQIFVTIPHEGRDRGKVFQITEADAWTADRWAMRAMFMLSRAGMEIPAEILQMGVTGFIMVAREALRFVDYAQFEPLADELMTCVRIVPTPTQPHVVRDILRGSDDVEELATIRLLRGEVLKLHANFTEPSAPSTSPGAAGDAR